jgi:carbon-monoxide dehydrogenase large subunit
LPTAISFASAGRESSLHRRAVALRRLRGRCRRAETKNQARDAAELVTVDYEELPAVGDPANARASGAPQVHVEAPNNTIYHWVLGDKTAVDGAFARAAHVVEIDLVNNRLVPKPSNRARRPRSTIAPRAISRCTPPRKTLMSPGWCSRPSPGSLLSTSSASWASRRLGVPVRWTADRSAHRRDHITHAAIAFDANHTIIGLWVKTIANLGAYMSTFSSAVPTNLYATLLSGQYDIPTIYAEVDAITATATRPRSLKLGAELFGVPLDQESVVHGDADKVQFGSSAIAPPAPPGDTYLASAVGR